MFPVHGVEKGYSHAMLEPEIVEKENNYKEDHKYPENSIFSKKLID